MFSFHIPELNSCPYLSSVCKPPPPFLAPCGDMRLAPSVKCLGRLCDARSRLHFRRLVLAIRNKEKRHMNAEKVKVSVRTRGL